MTAFSRFRIVMLFLATVAPVAIVIACAGEPADDGDAGNGNGGTGMIQCQPPQTNCNGVCATVGSDPLNCSACGAACAFGQKCMAGACTCDAPYKACGLSCFNIQSDPANCGDCNTACPASLPYCSAGVCSATCTQTTCGTLCTDTMTDIRNCGTCGTACALGQGCASGVCACPAGQMLCGTACATTCGGGTGGTGAGGASATGGTTATGGASGAGPTGGSGGMVVQKLCATKVVPAAALITDFESYDGMKPAYGTGSWTFTIGPAATPAYAGLYGLSEMWNDATMMGPATYTLSMAAGQSGNWAVHAANTATTDWGGGIGMWMGCVNASTFTGISFYVRGSAPTMKGNFSLAMESATAPTADPAGGGTCTPAPTDGCKSPGYEFPITVDWTLITIPWASFTTGVGASGAVITPNGDLITGMSFGALMNYVPNPVDGGTPAYVAEPGAYQIDIDNLSFTQ
jgi:hypothetical protein